MSTSGNNAQAASANSMQDSDLSQDPVIAPAAPRDSATCQSATYDPLTGMLNISIKLPSPQLRQYTVNGNPRSNWTFGFCPFINFSGPNGVIFSLRPISYISKRNGEERRQSSIVIEQARIS